MPTSDIDLVARAQDGDAMAFEQLISAHQGRVWALAYRILGNAEDAADIAQETFLRAWRYIGKFRRDCEFATWLHRITVNLCLSRKRRKEPDTVPFDEDLLAHTDNVMCADSTTATQIVRKVLAGLPNHYRVMLVLREIEERPFEEIAKILGCSAQSARTRACKARKMLRERMLPLLEVDL